MSKEDKLDAWMPLYIGDWDGDTAHLSCEEDGAYGRLIRRYWRMGPLPSDDIQLARIVRMDLKSWRRVRPVLEAFFQIDGGLWRHKRVDAELVRWAAKKAAAIEKARIAAEKRWGKSNAPSTPQASSKQSPSSSPFQEEGPSGPSSLKGEKLADRPDGSPASRWNGPTDVWDAFERLLGSEWCASWLAPCAWQDVPERALVPANVYAGKQIIRDGRPVLIKLNLSILEKVA